MVDTSTVCGYGALGLMVCGYLYLADRKPRRQVNTATQQKELRDRERERVRAAQKEKEDKTKKIKSGGESSGNEARKRTSTKKEAKETAKPIFTTTDDNTRDKDADDREFARQLSNVKTGTSMAPRQEAGTRQKSVKLSKAKTSDDGNVDGWANGQRGSDGDDDLSSAASPDISAAVLRAGDVADMLENNTNTGPSILRLTEPTNPQLPKAQKQVKQKEPELTKKQRQNQQKKEIAKVQREEDEKSRRALEEKQRRIAREAEGRSAKDGSSTIYQPPPPKTSAWASTSSQNASQSEPVALLDTYDRSADAPGSGRDASQATLQQASSQPPPPPAPITQYSDLPSEEEQLRMLSENDESGWNEVTSKKSTRKLTKPSSEVLGSNMTTMTNGKFDKLGDDAEA